MSDEQMAAEEAMDSVVDDGGAVDEVAGGDESTGSAEGSDLPEFKPFDWEEDGKKFTFSRRAELADFLKNRTGQAKSELQRARERAQHFEKRSGELQTKEQSLNEAYSKISKMDKFLKENPKIAQRIAQEMQGSKGNPELDQLLEERLKPFNEKLSKYEKAEQERNAEQRREKTFKQLEGEVEGFDRSQVLAEINRLQELPEDRGEAALYELVHYALQGKRTPADVERKFAESASKRRPPSVTSTTGRGKQEPDPSQMSRSEQQEYALRIMDSVK
jgi:hypothetical protein